MKRIIPILFGLLALVVSPIESSAEKKRCGQSGIRPSVYVLGSSTVRNALGPILREHLALKGIKTRMWGKAASGLARPDFHDWPAAIPRVVSKYRPDIFVVALGTNDGQHLFARKGKWVRYQDKRWATIYAQRVDKMLRLLSGKRGERTVVWIGPTALPHARAAKRMRRISSILKERIRRFRGPAFFIDGIARTTDNKGRLRKRVRNPHTRTTASARESDNIHLTWKGVRWFLAEPVLDTIRTCTRQAARRPNAQ